MLQFPTREALIKSLSTDPQHAIFAASVMNEEVTTAAELAHMNLKALEEDEMRRKEKESSYSPAAAHLQQTLSQDANRKLK